MLSFYFPPIKYGSFTISQQKTKSKVVILWQRTVR
uniref:Uncharacterized protein n=2 Tax=unclassified Caudoviricetes TaxID=2788787 RepID=A0A8S5LK04_9CAUD|nr:MAG TPA: hypothetical protein [Siphoviridae sp. ctnhN1]DAG56452.1 MAG TPA: hypothetical protein [Caudoviricetes sp.]DAM77287.1 MAG TPA: hypothetical protein [Bacteriophage sp.]DAP41264.1 MAG TPA: hypothetical protein [Caudoviricetes sp.]DAR54848.1 MAG TPA: hypothetical protein [Caudoviricetes sp.]